MVGRDTPKPIRSGRPCKTSHDAGCGQRTENPPALAVGSVNLTGVRSPLCVFAGSNMKVYELMNLLGKFQANAEVEIWDFQSPDEMIYNEVDDIYEIRHSCTSCDFSTSSTVVIG